MCSLRVVDTFELHESRFSVCLWSTPSAESEPQPGDRIMFVQCSCPPMRL